MSVLGTRRPPQSALEATAIRFEERARLAEDKLRRLAAYVDESNILRRDEIRAILKEPCGGEVKP